MRKPPNYYLRNISRRWHTEIKKVDDKVIILSPYLTSETAEAILRGSNFRECEIYTIFSVHNFVSGASSLKTLKCLYEHGCKLYHLPKLHAKIVISPGSFATIGSQNLTRNGVTNKEASVIIFDQQEVKKIEELLKKWISDDCEDSKRRKLITFEMLEELDDKIVKSLQKRLRAINSELNKEINYLERDLWENEKERIKNRQLAKKAEEKRQQEEQKRQEEQRRLEEQRQQVVNAARARVQQFSIYGVIELELAQEFIRESAYWDHPSGSIVRAPKHSENIYKYYNNCYPNNYCWAVNFGSNTFLVGLAIYRCQEALLAFLEEARRGNMTSKPQLQENLKLIVQGAVSNHEGGEYRCYPADNNYMMFGNQAINISDFVNLILNKGGIDDHLLGLI